MNAPGLFDHLYFEHNNLRFRIVGPFTAGRRTAIIIRTIHDDGVWVRPPTYATENRDALVERSTVRMGKMFVAGREFPTAGSQELIRPINPFGWRTERTVSEESRELVTKFARQAGLETIPGWGLGGSRLLGSERRNSDIDIIFKSESEDLRAHVIGALDSNSVVEPWGHSQRAKKFVQLYNGKHLNPKRRNMFGGIWNGLRVDLFATFPEGLIASVQAMAEGSLRSQTNWIFRVLSSTQRTAYPVHLSVTGLTYPTCEASIVSFDPTAHYLLEGDTVTVQNVLFGEPCQQSMIAAFHSCVEIG